MDDLHFCRAAVAVLRLCWLALGPEQPLVAEVRELGDGAAELGMEWDLLCRFWHLLAECGKWSG